MGYYVFLLGSNLLISLLYFVAWLHLSGKLLQSAVGKRRRAQYLALSVGLQVALAMSLQIPTVRHLLYEVLDWNLTVFSIQAVVMLLFLYRGYDFSRAISTVALSYFFMNTMLLCANTIATGLMGQWLVQNGMNNPLFLYVNVGYSVATHAFAVLVSLAVGAVMDKTRFPQYFTGLFTTRRKAWLTCAISLLVMHSYSVTAWFVAPEYAGALVVVFFLVDVLFLFAVLFVAVFESNREKVKQQEAFIAQQQIYVQSLEGLQGELRAFRHDYQNLLSGLYLQASEGNAEAIQETLKHTLSYFDERLGDQIQRVTGLSRVELPEVKSLLLVKLMQAEEQGVPVELEIPAPVNCLAMSSGDFLRCLGILADNAIEASAGLRGALVRIALLQDNTGLALVVANPTKQKPPLHSLAKRGFTTKGAGRGTGLASYRALCARYQNVATQTSYESGVFRQSMQIRSQ